MARRLLLVPFVMSIMLMVMPAVLAQTPAAGINDGLICPVTFQPGLLDEPPMGWGSYGTAYGGEDLRVTLKPGGAFVAPNALVNEQGEIWDKFLFWGQGHSDTPLRVAGHRLDAEAPPLRADSNAGSGGLAVGLYFPTTGCWEITGMRGDDTVTFVLLVSRAYESPPGLVTGISNTGPIAGCDVTRPNASTPPGQDSSTTWQGNGHLWTTLPVDGVHVVSPGQVTYDRQVVIGDWPWVVADEGSLQTVDAKLVRLANGDQAASDGRFYAVLPDSAVNGVVPVWMLFSSEGCWEITGISGGETLTMRVLILLP